MKRFFKRIDFLLLIILTINYSCENKENNSLPIIPIIAEQTFTIDENSPNGTKVGTVELIDNNSNQTLTYSIINGNLDNAFLINSSNGEIMVNNSSFLDYETNPKFELTVKVSDDSIGSNSSSAIMTIMLIDILIPTDNMIGYYPFNGNANDESENENNGTVYGATISIDRFGNLNSAYAFDGIGAYIDINTVLLPIDGSDFSISLWVNSNNNIDGNIHTIFSQYQSNPAGRFHIYEYDGLFKVFSGANEYPSGNAYELFNVTNNIWTNITIVNEENLVDVYMNGNLIKENLPITNILNTSSLIGWDGFENRFYKGKIDDVIIYKRVLNETEIQILYKE
ncbi:MAG: cadherin domain-containing protein [Bacteroidales bacterium]|nr:cadherin domain-containing protein [Bacteroidales bacterium]